MTDHHAHRGRPRRTALALPLAAAPAAADPALDGVFTVSGVNSNNQLTPGPDGNMWVTLDAAGKDVARIAPDGTVTEFDSPNMTNPVGITAGPDGNLWVTQAGGVARFSPGDPAAAVPTSILDIASPQGITVGPDGNLWTASAGKVLRIPPANAAGFTAFDSTGLVSGRDITAGTDGALWVSDFDSRVVRVATDGTGQAFPIGGGSQGIAGGPAGQVAYSQQGSAPTYVGRLTAGGTEQQTPAPAEDPFGVAFGPDGAYWVALFTTNALGRLTPDGGYSKLSLPVNSGPRQVSAGPGNTVWVTLDTTEQVARVSGVTPPATGGGGSGGGGGGAVTPAAVQTTLVKTPKRVVRTTKPRAKVRFRFSSDPAATFQCRIDARPWRACASPKRYRLKPGGHRFAVRAVLDGRRDATPATWRFRVRRI